MFYDLSADGQTYHQRAIALLAQGWNPVQETSRTDDQRVDHYVFGSWLPPATLYRLTGQLEQAKLFNTILALSAFLIAAGVFLATADLIAWQAILVAVAVTLNPVIVTQTLSFMVDGQVASLITIIACSSIAVVDQPRAKVSWIVLYAAVGLLIAAKLSGLVYGILLLGALLIWFGLYQRPYVLTLAYGSVTTLAIGVFVMGTPLISNTVHIGHPFFPAIRTPQPEWPDAP
jgi:hypothetical protein